MPDTAPTDQARLALISEDSSLKLAAIAPDGAHQIETRLAMTGEEMLFMWPSWSPRGDALTVSASTNRRDAQRLELWHLPIADDEAQGGAEVVFRNPHDGLQVIAPGLAHYVHWAPRGSAIAVVGNVGSGLAISLVAPGRAEPQRLIGGAPIYFSWAPDARAVLVHRGAQLVLFDLTSGDDAPRQIQRARPSFRTPAWSVDGDSFFFAKPRAGSGSILVRAARDSDGAGNPDDRDELMALERPAAFVRAPHDDRLAVMGLLDGDREGAGLTLFDPRDLSQRPISERPANAVYWSADGDALFAFEPQPGATTTALIRYDLTDPAPQSGRPRAVRLGRFQPSAEFATMLAFFDQFAQSHQILSPDGRWLTFAGLALNNGGSGRRGFGPQNGCYIVPTDGSAPPRRIAAGSIAFFPQQSA